MIIPETAGHERYSEIYSRNRTMRFIGFQNQADCYDGNDWIRDILESESDAYTIAVNSFLLGFAAGKQADRARRHSSTANN